MYKSRTTASDSHNGRVTDRYSWSQSISEVDVRFPIPPHIRRARNVDVKIRTNSFTIYFKDDSGTLEPQPYMSGEFTYPIRSEEGIWNLSPGDSIKFYLEKLQERWWDAFLVGESPIDLKKIDPTIPMENLPDEEQMKIAELMHKEEQKRMAGAETGAGGTETVPVNAEEAKLQEILKQAWDVEGSPFKGQPFDPSIVQIGNGATFPGAGPGAGGTFQKSE